MHAQYKGGCDQSMATDVALEDCWPSAPRSDYPKGDWKSGRREDLASSYLPPVSDVTAATLLPLEAALGPHSKSSFQFAGGFLPHTLGTSFLVCCQR